MSESVICNQSTNHPHAIYLKDYQVPVYLIDKIDLKVDLYDEYTMVTSRLAIRRNPLTIDSQSDLKLNGEELQLQTVKLNGVQLADSQYKVDSGFLIIHHVPDEAELEVVVKIHPEKNTALSGLYRSAKTYCTQCEAEGFRRITYFLDHPDVLSLYTTTITADEKAYPSLLSNGNLIASKKLEDGRHLATWEDPFRKPSYLFALVAGDFDLLEDVFITMSGKKVDLRIYVEKGYGDQAHHAMYAVMQAMKWDEEAYGREYDLNNYMIVAIGDFNMGAMENKGLNIFNTKYVLAKPETATDDDYINILSVVAHEYFHNWSGNRVTCRDWFQLSLKEGLTIFRDQSFSEDTLSRAVMRIRDVIDLREHQFPEDAGPLAHPVRPASYIEINNFYTSTIYNKGSEVLRMMQTILGKAMFRKGMDLYFERHDGQAVTIEDYVKVMEDVSGVDLLQFRRWYDQAGTPIVKVTDLYDAAKKIYTLTINQSCLPTPGQPMKLPLYIPITIGLMTKEGKDLPLVDHVLHLKESTQSFTFENVDAKPIPSLLRNFSAPIKLEFPYSNDDLLLLVKHDKDAFNRWEAWQKYALNVFLELIKDHQANKPLQLPREMIEVYAYLLKNDLSDKLFLTEMLALPSERYMGEQMSVVDVDAIHQVRQFAMLEIATQLKSVFLDLYQQHHDISGQYKFGMEEVGKRQLKNRCLSYLMLLPEYQDLGMKQFRASLKSNMTDTLAALRAITNKRSLHREQALNEFYAAWNQDALVMDKWFAIQAVSDIDDVLRQIKELLNNKVFDIKNPNKVYSLIGAFGQQNLVHFHAKDGSGYLFMREMVQRLDKLNPQVSARMVKPLTTWKRYDKERQALMQEQLEVILQDKTLSADLYELVTKSLERS